MPTGTGHTIWRHGEVEDTQEPMHTKFGVPGLTGCLAIHYFVLALLSAGAGSSCCPFCGGSHVGRSEGVAWGASRPISRTKKPRFKRWLPWLSGQVRTPLGAGYFIPDFEGGEGGGQGGPSTLFWSKRTPSPSSSTCTSRTHNTDPQVSTVCAT